MCYYRIGPTSILSVILFVAMFEFHDWLNSVSFLWFFHPVRSVSCFTFDGLTSPVPPADTCDSSFPRYNESVAISGCSAQGKHLAIPRNLDELSLMVTASGAPTQCSVYWTGCKDNVGGSYHCFDGSPIISEVSVGSFVEFYRPLGLIKYQEMEYRFTIVKAYPNRVAICEYPKGKFNIGST